MEANENLNFDPTKSDRIVAQAVDELRKDGADPNLLRLSSGVVLRAKEAGAAMIIRIMAKFQRPQPPTYIHPVTKKEIVNPDDPDYIDRVTTWKMDYSNGLTNYFIAMGTELVEKPKTMPGPNDDAWLDEYRMVTDLEIHADSPTWRYLTWVMFKAAQNTNDLQLIMERVSALSGVKEADVRAAENFPAGN